MENKEIDIRNFLAKKIISSTIEEDLSDIDNYNYEPYYEKRFHSIYSESLDSGRYPEK